MNNLFGYTFAKLSDLMVAQGQKSFRATQLYSWIYEKRIFDFDLMSDISAPFRETLKTQYSLKKLVIHQRQNSADGTVKLLLRLEDQHLVETVLMRYKYGNVVCVSSQVGCNMGCSFCASGLLKRQRNLNTAELVLQVQAINDLLYEEKQGQRVSHVVVMGTGEPFDNYDNVMDFVRIINHPKAYSIGARHISVSTCGLPDRIRQYALEGLQINLAISLHAPNNALRSKIMKINDAYPLDQLMDAVRFYAQKTGRRITFEYILIDGVNDSMEQADELAILIRGLLSYVNLIPYNEVMENDYRRSPDSHVYGFLSRLLSKGITATIRKEFGEDIDAACGQLRAKNEHEKMG